MGHICEYLNYCFIFLNIYKNKEPADKGLLTSHPDALIMNLFLELG